MARLSELMFVDAIRRYVDALPPEQNGWLAGQALASGRDPVGQIAARLGYDSEAAFNRAFKREYGAPPATWRRQRHLPA